MGSPKFLPVTPLRVVTPVDEAAFEGVTYQRRIVGVSIIRAGEAMETALRSCCRNIRIGKILIQRDHQTAEPQLFYTKFPDDIHTRHVLLLDPMLATGASAKTAVAALLDRGVAEEKIIFINLFSSLEGIRALHASYPGITIATAAIDEKLNNSKYIVPGCGDFGDRYFGTE
uniref:uracil phosphoribosyltransferase n=1 Tax=Compsopogon caeruleus TaxID=31354 RepID=A0A6T6CZ94_9RHOD|mmetsp:Transcript_5326/g.10952  ORF Transcript_5326/g.10952 Transcript_5326/m.10952 type:complete len:172 (+) Transcript_5326:1048-1563(+)